MPQYTNPRFENRPDHHHQHEEGINTFISWQRPHHQPWSWHASRAYPCSGPQRGRHGDDGRQPPHPWGGSRA